MPGGDAIFQRIFTRIGCKGRPPQFLVEYHPYAGLTLTIRLRHDVAQVGCRTRCKCAADSAKRRQRFCWGDFAGGGRRGIGGSVPGVFVFACCA